MASRTLRRRLRHGDVDGKWREHIETSEFDGLDEPLLGNYSSDDRNPEVEDHLDVDQAKEQHHWMLIFSQLIAQWAQWLANIVTVPGTVVGWLLTFPPGAHNRQNNKLVQPSLSPLQEERLKILRQRVEVPFDGSLVEHQDALKQLWRLAFPSRELPALKSVLWKDMGWQGSDPTTDFRGGGFVSLENLIFFAQQYPEAFQRLLHKQDGTRAEWEYPFAVAGINISFMLVQMLNLQLGAHNSQAGIRFLELLGEDEMAFDKLYCVAFQMMDSQWLAKRATYMEFNEVLKSTRTQLERELSLDNVNSVKELPSYSMLRR